MKEFALIFRNSMPETKPSPEQMQQVFEQWMSWMAGMAESGVLVNRGNRLSISEGKVVKPGKVVVDGPYTEIKEFINGFTIIKADTLDEAARIAAGCPILNIGGNVEVRVIVTPEDNS